jgi:hypothetical protein
MTDLRMALFTVARMVLASRWYPNVRLRTEP